MNRYPGAVWRPVAYTGLHPRQPCRAAILHTNGGGPQLDGWWAQKAAAGEHIGAQYQVFADGRVECYVDPDVVVYHAYGASEWAFGIETEDDGDNRRPWTGAQVDTIARILHFHGVPARMLTGTAPADGVGFHQQQTAWNGSGHDCPGSVRVAQIPQVLAALAALSQPTPEDNDMTPEQDARLKRVEAKLDALAAPRRTDHKDTDPQHVSLSDVLTEVDNAAAPPAA